MKHTINDAHELVGKLFWTIDHRNGRNDKIGLYYILAIEPSSKMYRMLVICEEYKKVKSGSILKHRHYFSYHINQTISFIEQGSWVIYDLENIE